MMRGDRSFFLILLLVGMLSVFSSCGTSNGISPYSAREMAEAVVASQESLPPLYSVAPGEDAFARYVEDVYQVAPGVLRDGAVYYAEGTQASEIAVLRVDGDTEPDQVKTALEEYLKRRAAVFTGYFPQQAALVENSAVSVSGDFVALLICENPADAESVFLACFSDEPPELPVAPGPEDQPVPDTQAAPAIVAGSPAPTSPPAVPVPDSASSPDEYDAGAVLAAWESGDQSGLTEKNRAVLEACARVISEYITEDMTEDEKELVIHDWIAEWVTYDEALISNAPDAVPDPDNDNPYGALIRQTAECKGYTLSFQLFMDMLGIECITVYGTSWWGEEEHAWNMVRLKDDGEWYCVDVTWDDTADVTDRENAPVNHRYFNVTSDYMRFNDHQWDETAVPEATSDRFE